MADGLSGWNFRPEDEFGKTTGLAIVHMTTQSHRIDGHVGMIRYPPLAGEAVMAHASTKHGFTTVMIDQKTVEKLKMHFRITKGG